MRKPTRWHNRFAWRCPLFPSYSLNRTLDGCSGQNNFIKNKIRSLRDSLLNRGSRPVFFLSLFFLRRKVRRGIELRQCDWTIYLKVYCPWGKRFDGLPGWELWHDYLINYWPNSLSSYAALGRLRAVTLFPAFKALKNPCHLAGVGRVELPLQGETLPNGKLGTVLGHTVVHR